MNEINYNSRAPYVVAYGMGKKKEETFDDLERARAFMRANNGLLTYRWADWVKSAPTEG